MVDGIFFINHALNVKQLSVYNAQQRFEQTLETISSIDEKCPSNLKFIFDSSPMEPEEKYFKELTDRNVQIIYIGQVEAVKNFSLLGMRSLSETISFMIFLDWFKKTGIVGKRIYKLSGRYRLNNNFILNSDQYDNSFVFAKSLPSWHHMDKRVSAGIDRLFKLRLWHMDYSLLDLFQNTLSKIFDDCLEHNIDIEHSYYKHLHKYKCIELDYVGVCGNIAPNGEYIDE